VSVLNPLAREISAKIVYYGPGLSGKTSSLQFIYTQLKPTHRGELVSLETEGDRTLFFDFLPVQVERPGGFDLRLQLYTVPGQVFYGATRQLVLAGADGVIFVADSQREARERNSESLVDLKENLAKEGRDLRSVPFVLQYNKRDLPDVMTVSQLDQELNDVGAPAFETNASSGMGIVEALKKVVGLVNKSVTGHVGIPKSPRSETGRRMALDPEGVWGRESKDDGMAGQVKSALSSEPLQTRLQRATDRVLSGATPTMAANAPRDGQTIVAPASSPMSFSALFRDAGPVMQVEREIGQGNFAEAVHRAASLVSEVLEGLLGPNDTEGYATRALLLGLDGQEYLELRRLAGRPPSLITQNDALFALYLLVAARIKQARGPRF
jgi:signal recognition particle receptor subunit beta